MSLCLMLAAPRVQAQTRIPDEPTCPRCTIRVQRLATIGTADGPGALPGSSQLMLDGAGRFWVIHPPDLPIVFDSTGRVVPTPFRRGSGPYEFTAGPTPLPLPGDSTLALDGIGRRLTVLAPDLRPVRMIQLASMMGILGAAVQRWPERVIMNTQAAGFRGQVQPFSVMALGGSTAATIRIFGSPPGQEQNEVWRYPAHIVRSGSELWSAPAVQYRVAAWDSAGRMLRLLERTPSWFPHGPIRSLAPGREPPPYVSSLAVDESGLLWVFISVPASTWREAWPELPPGTSEVQADRVRRDRLHRTIIEIIDPQAGRVVARHSTNDFIAAAFPGRRGAIYYTDAGDVPRYALVRFTLSGR